LFIIACLLGNSVAVGNSVCISGVLVGKTGLSNISFIIFGCILLVTTPTFPP